MEGRGIEGCVLLDLRHLGKKKILEKLPQIWEASLTYAGVNLSEAPLPITPGVHYMMGGVKTDLLGQTALPGLYAVGECASISVHGANRLGGNALMETITYGRRVGTAAASFSTMAMQVPIPEERVRSEKGRVDAIRLSSRGERIGSIWKEIGTIMEEHFGIVRDRSRMRAGKERLAAVRPRLAQLALDDHGKIFNLELIEALQLASVMDIAEVIAASATDREESRGAHYRSDFPKRDDIGWLKHTLAYWTDQGPRLDYRGVTITRVPLAERVY
jgi:succinate dehydrogenase / fumarate reductase flavoprotein subunit